ncbi:MAG: HYExAFE family protein [Pirellulales bacterium]
MAKRENPYEAAFAAWLRARAVPFVEIHEAFRQRLDAVGAVGDAEAAAVTTKNLDFVVTTPAATWLVDVKGRRFPGSGKRYWNNWATREDLRGLAGWERSFGAGSGGLLIFAYLLTGDKSPLPADDLFFHRKQWFAFLGIRWFDYAAAARTISPKWGTVAAPTRRFRELARPARCFFETTATAPLPAVTAARA